MSEGKINTEQFKFLFALKNAIDNLEYQLNNYLQIFYKDEEVHIYDKFFAFNTFSNSLYPYIEEYYELDEKLKYFLKFYLEYFKPINEDYLIIDFNEMFFSFFEMNINEVKGYDITFFHLLSFYKDEMIIFKNKDIELTIKEFKEIYKKLFKLNYKTIIVYLDRLEIE